MPPLTQQFAKKINVLISASDLQFGGLGTCLCKECFSFSFLAETKSKTCQRWVANKRSLCLVFPFSHKYHHFIPGRANTSVLDNCLVTSGFLQSLTCWQNYNWVWPTERRWRSSIWMPAREFSRAQKIPGPKPWIVSASPRGKQAFPPPHHSFLEKFKPLKCFLVIHFPTSESTIPRKQRAFADFFLFQFWTKCNLLVMYVCMYVFEV